MALLIVVDAAAAIQEQTIKRLFLLTISEGEREFRGVSSIFGAARERWFGLYRTSHPDWVKIFNDPNGQNQITRQTKIQVSCCYKLP